MDGTLLNTEDLYTEATNELLKLYNKGPLTWDVKIKLQGRPSFESMTIMIEEYDLPLTIEEFQKISMEIQSKLWHKSRFLPGAVELVEHLYNNDVPIALGTSSNTINYHRKTDHLKSEFNYFGKHIVTGDDERIPKGKGKPHPDIWFACLASINEDRISQGLDEIKPEECLVFEDGIPGVISGIAANAHVIWIPDVNALKVLNGEEHNIIGTSGEILTSLTEFNKDKYFL
ncbi:uncharacterized protein SPAPADRAFT_60620 [Spathaspora passalidarum NRRL Y-27907]|uniref:Uncharacterized protein n=1 Tax=Spathaspora passalidarum (strain NRRL Y-27907 / 11-Y1) TaxID=619300 RepID=G3ALP4_SPAPN|nr:uncharacterized protein SPAPADRAFT_60620 [Spathaspora passalidarum NRRL Y-27907]EGW33287.1 hypothetical protein SPAPADRAFT_60620 [Spathaspora passalidarum NRRL Y-27907]